MGTEISKEEEPRTPAPPGGSTESTSVQDTAVRQREIAMADNAVRSKTRTSQNYQMRIIIRYVKST